MAAHLGQGPTERRRDPPKDDRRRPNRRYVLEEHAGASVASGRVRQQVWAQAGGASGHDRDGPREGGRRTLAGRCGTKGSIRWGVSARRSVRRVLSRGPRRGAVTVIHLGPPVARRLMRPTRGLRRRAGVPVARNASSYLALLRVELASFHPAAGFPPAGSSLWRWSSPRGGRALPATLRRRARTFLTPPVAR
jgi:hypothetical protein